MPKRSSIPRTPRVVFALSCTSAFVFGFAVSLGTVPLSILSSKASILLASGGVSSANSGTSISLPDGSSSSSESSMHGAASTSSSEESSSSESSSPRTSSSSESSSSTTSSASSSTASSSSSTTVSASSSSTATTGNTSSKKKSSSSSSSQRSSEEASSRSSSSKESSSESSLFKTEDRPKPLEIPGITTTTESGEQTRNALDWNAVQLGCFTDEGTWSTTRTRCAEDQKPFLTGERPEPVKTVTTSSTGSQASSAVAAPVTTRELNELEADTPIVKKIDEDFFADEREAKAREAKAIIMRAIESLSALGQNPSMPTEARIIAATELPKLQKLSEKIETNLTLLELNAQVAETKEVLTGISTSIQSVTQGLTGDVRIPTSADIAAIVTRLDGMFSRIPSAHEVLANAGIKLPGEAIQAYKNVQGHLLEVHESCISLAQCPALPLTVVALEKWRGSMEGATEAENRPDLLQEIERILLRD